MPNQRAEDKTTTTISAGRDEWADAKAKADSEGRSMSAVVRDLLRRWVSGEIPAP